MFILYDMLIVNGTAKMCGFRENQFAIKFHENVAEKIF